MKKLISLSLALMLLLGVLAVPALAEETTLVGTLSYLNMTEEQEDSFSPVFWLTSVKILLLHNVLIKKDNLPLGGASAYRHFDTMNDMLLALQAGTVNAIRVPYYTARYICTTNNKMKLLAEYHPENATGLADWALSRLSDGYSFMMKDNNTELRDAFDAQITAMKEDGTLQQLIDEHIVKVAEGGEPVAVDFEQFEGDPIKVGVTGDLPPMDYKAADDSFAGFNTAVLAEIGRRLKKNIELVQVDSVARALALSEGTVDVVFWTRGMSENLTDHRKENGTMAAKAIEQATDEEKAILREGGNPDDETKAIMDNRDLPPDAIITQPYFTDLPVLVFMNETP